MIKKVMVMTAVATTMLTGCTQKKDPQQRGAVENSDTILTVYLAQSH